MACSAYHAIPCIVVLLLLMSTCNCQNHVFYIISSDSSHCPQEVNVSQCYNLSTLVSEGHLSMAPNISLLFLPGEHILQQNLDVKNSDEFKMIPYSDENGVKIACTGHDSYGGRSSVRIQNVSSVNFNSISFHSCGVDVNSSGALQLRSVSHSEITNCKWYESRSSAIFTEESNIVVSDCKFMNGSCSDCSGGGIHAENSNVTITGSTAITSNSVLVGYGGGLSLTNSTVYVDGNMTVNDNFASSTGGGMFAENCTFTTTTTSVLLFENNRAFSDGGALFISDSQCIFTGYFGFFSNTATLGGGMLASNSHCTFNGRVEFSVNRARHGGGMSVRKKSDCIFNDQVEFSGNSAAYNGGGISVGGDSHCTYNGPVDFSGNSAAYNGGGISVGGNSYCTYNGPVDFSGNSAAFGDGGGILVRDNSHCTISFHIKFSGNGAAFDGGGMSVRGNSHCTFNGSVEFTGNYANTGGGMAVTNSNCNFYEHVEFFGNSAAYDGGGISVVSDSHCTFNRPVEFNSNSAISRNGGGMSISGNSQCTFKQHVEFSDNNAGDYGGGILVHDNSYCTFHERVEFSGNSATSYGGGVSVYSNSNCTFNAYVDFSRNSASYDGGMSVVSNSHCIFNEPVEFFGNNAVIFGGGMSVYSNSSCTFNEHVAFSDNNAADDGGGISVRNDSHCTFSGPVEFFRNTATYQNGGGLSIRGDSQCTFKQYVEFSDNKAGNGGGMAVDNSNCIFFGRVEFSGNSATYDGGGISVLSNSYCTFTGTVEFSGNNALRRNGGGMLVSADSYCTFNEKVNFSANSATNGGGNLVHDNSHCIFSEHVEFSGNRATTNGGGMLVDSNSSCTFTEHVDFSGNNAAYGGGMAVSYYSYCTFNGHVQYYYNGPTTNGGAISVYSDSNVTFKGHAQFSGNSATDNGGGISIYSYSSCTFNEYANFSDNSAADDGGGISIRDDSHCTFNGQVEFSGNSAVNYGGGGISVEGNSHCTFNEYVEFSDNDANAGGGMAVNNSNCSFNGHVQFSGNSAEDDGGGMSVTGDSHCTFNRQVDFFGNGVAYDGGGISIRDNSHSTFNGPVQFYGNNAISRNGGGMSVSEDSHCNFKQHVDFSGNNAANYGGGILVHDNSYCTFYESVEFSGNSATIYGGGMSVYSNSNCTFNGCVKFYGNYAAFGGGMSALYDSYCTFNEHVEFSGNNATNGGGMIVAENTNSTFSRHVEFSGNNAAFGGGLHVVLLSHCIFKINSTAIFADNNARSSGGSLYAGQESSVTFLSQVNISTSIAGREGGGILMRDKSLLVMSGETTLTDNRASSYGGAISLDFGEIRIKGNSQISNNSAQYGGAIQAVSGEIHILSGDHHFEDNSAQYGGGWSLFGGSSIHIPYSLRIENTADLTVSYLYTRLNIYFISNQAEQYGGAIWVENTPYYSCPNNVATRCFLRGEFNKNDLSWQSNPPGVIASNNTAVIAGSNLYGGNIDSCSYDIEPLLLVHFLNAPIDSISSDPYQVCLCIYNEPDCSISDHYIEIFSGEQLELILVGVGQRNGTVPAVILSNTDPPGSSDDGSMTQSAPATCKVFSYTITSEKQSVKLMLYPESLCPKTSLQMLTVTVKIKPCPPGFMLNHQTKSCTCNDTLTKLDNNIQCDIDSQSFSHEHGVWIGNNQLNDTVRVIYHPHCPFDYCKQELSTFTLNSSDDQCRYNRSGFICGACGKGYSLTLGGSKCKECSHLYLLLLIPLALAGVVLVLLLLALKLTVSMGTINGLIFFANIIGTNSSIFLPPESTVVLRVFIAWLNLDLGIDTCLFDGLDTYIKIWLQFVFPLYVFVLIGLIIFVSQRSTLVTKCLGNDPVAVLATLILLAYTKLIRTVFTVMSFTYIQGFDGSSTAVWLYDGNVRYLRGKHIPLFMFALLTMLLLIIPYTVVLLFAPYMQRYSKNRVLFWINDYRLKAFLDSNYAPLKDKYRSWIGLLLVLRLCLLLIFVSNSLGDPSINLLAITAAVILLLSWRLVLPGTVYTNWCLDALEVFFLMKLCLFSVSSLYVLHTSGNQRALADTLVGVAFIVFVAITVYHVWRQLTDSRWWRLTLKPKWEKYFNTKKEVDPGVQEDDKPCTQAQIASQVPTTFIELREPVLEFT